MRRRVDAQGIEIVPWWKSSRARRRVCGWNLRVLVCERCRGLGWVYELHVAPCPFCGGAARLSRAMLAERIDTSESVIALALRASARKRRRVTAGETARLFSLLTKLCEAGAFPPEETPK